ncbi:ATPase family associated with various cellular activities (AAA) [Aquisphaera giovannonii]|uniref:ATPase family associated with various cellular activities (AAA) n=1 Tax=Aquisphaera giovannonii TaxID=406548 RepID=A0A5B9VZR7_9BACT|nr:MoxR family ATPase [Aquisphaera giovannonii]QEH33926.1 ATPase family associated with various cellular activities (AAA) [Aquisphaera giovannonii]
MSDPVNEVTFLDGGEGDGEDAPVEATHIEAAAPVEPRPAAEGSRDGTVAGWSRRVTAEINKVFIGQDRLVRGVLAALLAGGHVLVESVPGLGKTLLVRAFGRALGCDFNRIQFTPDLMPSDVTGSPIYDERIHDFRFRPGPVFTQLLLADEINRAPAKTHAALLEIMQESRVTVDGTDHRIEPPFLVMATQNPIESEGTYNLPEAQLDRFLFKLVASYPGEKDEIEILRMHTRDTPPDRDLGAQLAPVTSPAEVIAMQGRAARVLADDHVLGYITALVRATRKWPAFAMGVSPRAGVAMLKGARAIAALEGRDYTVPDDVQEVVLPALRHRVVLTPEAEVEGRSPDELLSELVRSVEVPIR